MIYAVYLDKHGYDCDKEYARSLGLIKGNKYPVKVAYVGRSSTDVVLEQFDNKQFNSVMFDYFDENDNEVCIYDKKCEISHFTYASAYGKEY